MRNIEMKNIPNTNERYYATSDGHIYDKKRNKLVAENKCKGGWLKCHIWFNNRRITICVHRLIMYAFVGISTLTVNHKDGNKENNSINNLEYMTVPGNIFMHSFRSKLIRQSDESQCILQNFCIAAI